MAANSKVCCTGVTKPPFRPAENVDVVRHPSDSITWLGLPAGLSPWQHVLLEVTTQAIELKRLNINTMNVVIRPDQDTEILLRLHRHNGKIEVESRMQKGNYTVLDTHWDRLQQVLASQDIMLTQLQPPPNGSRHHAPAEHPLSHPRIPHNPRYHLTAKSECEGEPYCVGSATETPGRPATRPMRRRRAKIETYA